jgi:two-component system sensor histidine kinase CreC
MRFTRITLFFIAFIITLGFYQLARHFLAEVEPQTFQATEEMMVDTANLLAETVAADMNGQSFDTRDLRKAIDAAHARRFDSKIFDHLKHRVGINAYLTDSKGIVIFDSDGGRREGENYACKLDVGRTLAGRYGARSSRSNPEDPASSIMYVAAPVGDPSHPAGVYRFSSQRATSCRWSTSGATSSTPPAA